MLIIAAGFRLSKIRYFHFGPYNAAAAPRLTPSRRRAFQRRAASIYIRNTPSRLHRHLYASKIVYAYYIGRRRGIAAGR